MEIRGRVVIVTGGGRGIGRATSFALAEAGAKVVVAARQRDEIEQTCAAIRDRGGDALGLNVDVSDSERVEAMVERALSSYGQVDALVNNAGIAFAKPVTETSEVEWNRMLAVNLTGIFLCTRAVLPVMLDRGGVIVNISSGAGKSGFPNLSAYCATKFGVIGFTESVAREALGRSVRVYGVCPGGVNTSMYQDLFGPVDSSRLIPIAKVATAIVDVIAERRGLTPGRCLEVYE